MKKVLAITLLLPCVSFAAHPLITDDTGTQGTSGFQFEVNTDASRKEAGGAVDRRSSANATLTYGWTDTVDLALNVPYQKATPADDPVERGLGDVGLALKWRLWEKDGFSLGLKPQVFLSTGDEQRELGNGKTWYGANLLAAYETDLFAVMANAGYTNNRNMLGSRKNLWNVSAAGIWKIDPKLKAVLDMGTYRNPDPADNENPAFTILGMIYSPTEKLDLDIGIKKGLNRAEEDHAVGVGLTVRW